MPQKKADCTKTLKESNQPTLLVMAGGTGGHIFPALAVADYLLQANWRVHWLGSNVGMENQIVPKSHIPLSTVTVSGVRGKGFSALLKAPWRLIKAILEAKKIIKAIQPNVVLGMGGFASGPGAVAAKWLGIPLVIHEQNAIAGFTNRLSSLFAKKCLQGFPDAFRNSSKTQVIGNPVRKSISEITHQFSEKGMNILVFGGSRGAKALNDITPQVVNRLSSNHWQLWHQVGSGHRESVIESYQQHKVELSKDDSIDTLKNSQVLVTEFIDDMDKAYAWADLVICRAGALTISELAIVGLPAILVPFPFAVDDHQTANARFLTEAEAAILLPQSELSKEKLLEIIEALLIDDKKLLAMSQKAKQLGKPNATADVSKVCDVLRKH
ncbi:MAG: undecaprenyldiphospho-muramoylpentapeptide beta-N-acetylglucosaminyltransferase [Pseudomonadota bacterium]